jgi:predicted DNA-binding transcriptional regulator YafY
MAQKDATKRQALIINFLRRQSRTFKEIEYYLETESEIQSYDLNISIRTFQRDIHEISSLWGIDIVYNRSTRKYEIVFDEADAKNERLMEAFSIFNTLNVTERISEYIHFENRKTSGTHFMMDIITGIKNRKTLEIYHNKYWEKEFTRRQVEPLGIKEYRYRWYLIAKDLKDNNIKSFGLDRILNINQLEIKYSFPKDFDVNEYFKYSYGVIGLQNEKPEIIELSFTAFQGKYIKNLPMHHSQKILIDNEEELRISLNIVVTLDFIMDLQQYAETVKVIKPKWLVDELKNNFKEAINQY